MKCDCGDHEACCTDANRGTDLLGGDEQAGRESLAI